jgi:hypothetical protein
MNFVAKIAAALGFAAIATAAFAASSTEVVSPKGRWLAQKLDSMGVETKWIAGEHIDWRSGEPDGRPELHSGRHTHCSAFVAAAAESVGVHILRPPEHGQILLANAQFHWLEEDGAAEGWRALPDGKAAQAAANAGELVVVSYLSHNPSTPGHIAIVKPASRSAAEIEADGPLVIQAGTTNSNGIAFRLGFAGHPAAWRDHEAEFYAHAIPAAAGRS